MQERWRIDPRGYRGEVEDRSGRIKRGGGGYSQEEEERWRTDPRGYRGGGG